MPTFDCATSGLGPGGRPLPIRVGSDLAGLFEVKEGRAPESRATVSVENGILRLGGRDGRRSATVRSSPPAALATDGTVIWEIEVPARGEWTCCIEVAAGRDGQEVPPSYRCGAPTDRAAPSARQARWQATLPDLTTDVPGLGDAVARAGYDLGALRIFDPHHPEDPVVAAGAPWFMTLFGRDSLITSWMALVLDPRLALATVRTLARLQGTKTDPATDEQPGRILHEVRLGGSASLSLADGDIYYGTADATPLFVMLVAELYRWGLPLADLRPLLPAVDAALALDGRTRRPGRRRLSGIPAGEPARATQPGLEGLVGRHLLRRRPTGRRPDRPRRSASLRLRGLAGWRRVGLRNRTSIDRNQTRGARHKAPRSSSTATSGSRTRVPTRLPSTGTNAR